MRIQNCFVLFALVFTLNACTVPTSPITVIKTPERPVLTPIAPVPTVPDSTPGYSGRIVLSAETAVLSTSPCTLESQAPPLVAQPATPTMRWDTSPTVTRKQMDDRDAFVVPIQIVRDPNGNTFLEAKTTDTVLGSIPTYLRFGYVAKFDVRGHQVWSRDIVATYAGKLLNIDAQHIVADQSGSTYLTVEVPWWVSANWSNSKTRLVKLDPDGNFVWERPLPQGDVKEMRVDARGQLWVLKSNFVESSPTSPELKISSILQRFDPAGKCRLEVLLEGINLANNVYLPTLMAADDSGSIYLTGIKPLPTPASVKGDLSTTGPFITKLDWQGKPVWTHFLNASRNNDSDLWSWIPLIRVVGPNLFVAASDSGGTNPDYPRLYLEKFDLEGNLVWARDIRPSEVTSEPEGKTIQDLIGLGNGDLLMRTYRYGDRSNCCHANPWSEDFLSHLGSDGRLIEERQVSPLVSKDGIGFRFAWVGGPGDLVTTLDSTFSETSLTIKQFDPIALFFK